MSFRRFLAENSFPGEISYLAVRILRGCKNHIITNHINNYSKKQSPITHTYQVQYDIVIPCIPPVSDPFCKFSN